MAKISTQLPVEVWEHVIDIIADMKDDSSSLYRENRKTLSACCLVCRAWGPRCRLYLFQQIHIVSRESLQSLSVFLWKSPFHARLVQKLQIKGNGADQSWIATVPAYLPKLPNLDTLSFASTDFRRQHPSFSQLYSRFRLARVERPLSLDVSPDDVNDAPGQVASLAAALHVQDIARYFHVNTLPDVLRINAWPRRLSPYTSFWTEGTVQDLLKILPDWSFAVQASWVIRIHTTALDGLGEAAREIFRLAARSSRSCEINVEGVVRLVLSLDPNAPTNGDRFLMAEFEVDDEKIKHLSLILLGLRSYVLTRVEITLNGGCFAGSETFNPLDVALSALNEGSNKRVEIQLFWNHFVVTPQLSSFRCLDDFYKTILPRCVAEKILVRCKGKHCVLHRPEALVLESRGTLPELLEILTRWTHPFSSWEIAIQSTLQESLGGLSQVAQKFWEEISRVFRMSIARERRRPSVLLYINGLGIMTLSVYDGVHSVKYKLWITLEDASDETLAYLSHILPHFRSCSLSYVFVQIKSGWSANTSAWHALDEVLLRLIQTANINPFIGVDPDSAVPAWAVLPYRCFNEFLKEKLPGCATVTQGRESALWCHGLSCRLHDVKGRSSTSGRGSSGTNVGRLTFH